MKSLRGYCIGAALGIMAANGLAVAQSWGPEIQVTNSGYDDRNVVALIAGYENIWVFWDRDIAGERQIFFRRMNYSGQWLQNEEQFTFGPGSNSHPNVARNYTNSPMVLCWEHGTSPSRVIQFSYYYANAWSPVYTAFSSYQDVHNPWTAQQGFLHGLYWINKIIIMAQTENTVLSNYYLKTPDTLALLKQEEWPQNGLVSHLSCDATQDYFGYAWQVTTSSDTLIYWRQYRFTSGWTEPYLLTFSGLFAYNPVLNADHTGYAFSQYLAFNHIQDNVVKTGQIRSDGWGHSQILTPEYFSGFAGNQFDPLIIHIYWEFYRGAFVSDINGNLDVFFVFADLSITQLTDSDNNIHPACVTPIWTQWRSTASRAIVLWESDRSGNWDIWMRVSQQFTGVMEPDEKTIPQQFSVSVFPNPSNSQFLLSLELPAPGWTRVNVWDLAGRRVGEVYDGMLPSGKRTFTWNAENANSGIYILKAENRERVQCHKLVLLK